MPDLKTVTFDACQWQLVPKVPTEEMIDAAREAARNWSDGFPDHEDGYYAMLAAAPTPAAQSAGQEAVAWFIADDNGRPFKAVCYALERDRLEAKGHKLLPLYAAPVNAAGQEAVAANFACYLIDHCEGETVTEELVQLWLTRMLSDPQYAAPVSGGTQGVWDVYAFGKWQRRVSAPVAWDAHAVYLDMVKNGWSKDIELRAISSENYSAPVNGGERELGQVIDERDQYHDAAEKLADAIAKHFGVEIGEHSNLNCPWQNALDHIAQATKRAADAQQVGGDIDDLVGKYWELAYNEGKTGVSHGDAANLVLSQIRAAVRALTSPAKVGGDEQEALTDEQIDTDLMFDAACECLSPEQLDAFEKIGDADTFARLYRCVAKRAALSADGGEDKRDADESVTSMHRSFELWADPQDFGSLGGPYATPEANAAWAAWHECMAMRSTPDAQVIEVRTPQGGGAIAETRTQVQMLRPLVAGTKLYAAVTRENEEIAK